MILRLWTAIDVGSKWLCSYITCNRPERLNVTEGLKALYIACLVCKRYFTWHLPLFNFVFPKLAFSKVENDPHLKLMYTECLRLCGTWLAETCLENPTVIMQKYLEKVHRVLEMCCLWDNAVLKYDVWKSGFLLKCYSFTIVLYNTVIL